MNSRESSGYGAIGGSDPWTSWSAPKGQTISGRCANRDPWTTPGPPLVRTPGQELFRADLTPEERAFVDTAEQYLAPAKFLDARLREGSLYIRMQSGRHGQQVVLVPDLASPEDVMQAYQMPWGEFLGPWIAVQESEIVRGIP